MQITYKRVLLKISGEALTGDSSFGIDQKTMKRIAKEISESIALGISLCIVIGGGNICRGVSASESGIERTTADYMGMLATVMNALAFQNVLEREGVTTRVLSALPMQAVCEPYIRRRAVRHLQKERVVIFAAGTGNPFFTTDTAAALRATEMECNVLLKGTQVNGVYSRDPRKYKDAAYNSYISYQEVLSNPDIRVMDQTAIALCQENNIPILVFNIHESGALLRCLQKKGDFTMVGK